LVYSPLIGRIRQPWDLRLIKARQTAKAP